MAWVWDTGPELKSSTLLSPIGPIQHPAPIQFAFLVLVEVETPGHTTGIVALDAQAKNDQKDHKAHGKCYGDDQSHEVLIAGGIAAVILIGGLHAAFTKMRCDHLINYISSIVEAIPNNGKLNTIIDQNSK